MPTIEQILPYDLASTESNHAPYKIGSTDLSQGPSSWRLCATLNKLRSPLCAWTNGS